MTELSFDNWILMVLCARECEGVRGSAINFCGDISFFLNTHAFAILMIELNCCVSCSTDLVVLPHSTHGWLYLGDR